MDDHVSCADHLSPRNIRRQIACLLTQLSGCLTNHLMRRFGRRCPYEQGFSGFDYLDHIADRTRPKASLIYRRTKNLRAVQLLLGHAKLASTVRYFGIEVHDALEMAEQTEV